MVCGASKPLSLSEWLAEHRNLLRGVLMAVNRHVIMTHFGGNQCPRLTHLLGPQIAVINMIH